MYRRGPWEDNAIFSRPTLGWCREGEASLLCIAEDPGKIMSYSHAQPGGSAGKERLDPYVPTEVPGGAGRERLDPYVPQRLLVIQGRRG